MYDIFHGLIEIGMFVTFGLPVLISGILLITGSFSEGMPLSWNGRINRRSFFIHWIISDIAMGLGATLLDFDSSVILVIGITIIVLAALRIFSIQSRRLHDFGVNGTIVIIIIILGIFTAVYTPATPINLIANLILGIYPGNKDYNKYGAPPEKKISVI